jgi:hypothetical protein
VLAAGTGASSEEPSSGVLWPEQILDGFTSEFGDGGSPSFGFMTKSCVEFVRQFDRRSLHVCQHTQYGLSRCAPLVCSTVVPCSTKMRIAIHTIF